MQDRFGWARVVVSRLEQLPHVTRPVKHPEDDYVTCGLTVVDHVSANRKAAHAWMEILSEAADPWRPPDAYKRIGETGDELLGGFRAAATSDVTPDFIQIGPSVAGDSKPAHESALCFS